MRVNLRAGLGDKWGQLSFQSSIKGWYVESTLLNRIDEAILMSTYNLNFMIRMPKIS